MKHLLIIILTLLYALSPTHAQQIPLFSQYQSFQGLINPAAPSPDYLTDGYNMAFNVSSRIQWLNLKGAPRTYLLNGTHIVERRGTSLLLGGHLVQDKIGPTSTTGGYARLAGIFSGGDPYFGGVSIGLSFGAAQFQINSEDIQLIEPSDFLGQSLQKTVYPDVGAGIYLYRHIDGNFLFKESKVYVGLSVPQILGVNIRLRNEKGVYRFKRIPHYYVQIGSYNYFAEDKFWEPSIWVKYTAGIPIQIDFNNRFRMNDSFWLGAGIANNKNFHLETGIILGAQFVGDQRIRIGYGYDHSFTDFGPFIGTTHELNVSMMLNY